MCHCDQCTKYAFRFKGTQVVYLNPNLLLHYRFKTNLLKALDESDNLDRVIFSQNLLQAGK